MRLAQGARTLGQRRGGGVDGGCEGCAPTAVVASVCRPVGDSVVCSSQSGFLAAKPPLVL